MRTSYGIGLLVLWATQVWGIGYVYTGVGGGGRELLEMTSVAVDVRIEDRVAVTRMDQVFTNTADNVLEGIYEFALPSGAIITDLVLWIGDKRVQGLILEKEHARRTYDDVVERRIDPALVEQVSEERFRLSIFPFPERGSRRVELEYSQVLAARDGEVRYRFPLALETEQRVVLGHFALRAEVSAQQAFELAVPEPYGAVTQIERQGDSRAEVFFADEEVATERDLDLVIAQRQELAEPTVLSYAPEPGEEFGYYALWLPPVSTLLDPTPVPRSITFAIDVSSSMRGDKLAAVKGALAAAVEALGAEDYFNIIVYSNSAGAFAAAPVPADAANKEDALAFVRRQGALGATNFAAALRAALGQRFPDGRLNHLIFLTDGHPTLGETGLDNLAALVAALAGEGLRLFTIGVGNDVNRSFLRGLAEDHRGSHSYVAAEGDIEAALRALFAEFTRPVFLPRRLETGTMELHDVYPADADLISSGQEFFQVGRYRAGGPFTLKIEGQVQNGELAFEYPLEFTADDRSRAIIPRLWAHQKVKALEGQVARYGSQPEMLDDILDLGLTYRLVTSRTSLFAPDEEVVVNPPVEGRFSSGSTAVEEKAAVASWLGKTFELRDRVWVDTEFEPDMEVVAYDPQAPQPRELASFARLGREMLVALGGRGYAIAQGVLPVQPVLAQNYPNPFNPDTQIRFYLPLDARVQLGVYNLLGQLIRTLEDEFYPAGAYRAAWDGLDDQGRMAATGVYIYRLQTDEAVLSRRMLLLR